MITLPNSKAVVYTLSAASFACAILLTVLYGLGGQLHPGAEAQTVASVSYAWMNRSLSAKAAVVYDPTTKKILFEKNPHMQLPLASLTKLMTADAVLSLSSDTSEVTFTADDLKPDGDWGFSPGEAWKLRDLLTFGLVASSNDAMAAAAAAAPGNVISHMNARAIQLGLSETYFSNSTGLDLDAEVAGAYGSARDMALLATAFLSQYPALFEASAAPSVSIHSGTHVLEAESTALPLQEIPGLIGAKTGYTDLAGGNLVAAFDLQVGHPIIIAVLGSTRDGRFEDVKQLLAAAREALAQ